MSLQPLNAILLLFLGKRQSGLRHLLLLVHEPQSSSKGVVRHPGIELLKPASNAFHSLSILLPEVTLVLSQ